MGTFLMFSCIFYLVLCLVMIHFNHYIKKKKTFYFSCVHFIICSMHSKNRKYFISYLSLYKKRQQKLHGRHSVYTNMLAKENMKAKKSNVCIFKTVISKITPSLHQSINSHSSKPSCLRFFRIFFQQFERMGNWRY